jgi:hypothetical protein
MPSNSTRTTSVWPRDRERIFRRIETAVRSDYWCAPGYEPKTKPSVPPVVAPVDLLGAKVS